MFTKGSNNTRFNILKERGCVHLLLELRVKMAIGKFMCIGGVTHATENFRD